MTPFRLRILAQTLPFLLLAPGLALAQHAPTRGEATAALNQPAKPGAQQYTRQQIDQLVAPIALYPDQLLSQVLMAATYPDQIVQAAQWVQQGDHRVFEGDALAAALEPMPWEPSVKALCAFPQLIQMMADHTEWTEALGVAFATQQAEVMARVQALRHLAMKSGRLAKMKHLKVQEGQTIVITEAEPGRIFIPVYNPTVVYGQWPDRDYPPVFIPPPQGFVSETIEPGLEVSIAYTAVRPLWGWSRIDWRDERITVDRDEYTRITRNVEVGPGDTWRHRGPVVLVAPTSVSRTTTVSTNVPAGTVAPARAAAVSVLPQRAAADPARIKTQSSTTETRTTQPGRADTGTTNRPGTQPDQNRATAQPGATQPEKGQSGTTQPQNAQTGAQPGASKPEKAQSGTNRPEHGQARSERREESQPARNERTTAQPGTTEPGKAELNPAKPNEAQRHPEAAGSSRENREGAATTRNPANRLNQKEAAPPNAGAKPASGSAAQEQERAKTPSGSSQQLGAPERESRGMPSPREQNPARTPEHAGGSSPPAAQHPPGQPPGGHGPEHAGQQPPAGAPGQAKKPQHAGPEAGQGSSTPPAPQAQPSAQKPQQGPEHAGRPEQKQQNENKER